MNLYIKEYIKILLLKMIQRKLTSIKSIYASYFETNVSNWNDEMCDLYENYYLDMKNEITYQNMLFNYFDKMNIQVNSKKLDICYFLQDADPDNSIDDWYYTRFWKKIIKNWNPHTYFFEYSVFLSKGSEATIYLENSSLYTHKTFDEYISMFRESFKLFVLYKYFPKYVPEIPIIGKTMIPHQSSTFYFYSQTYYDNGTYKDMLPNLTFKENINILIYLGNMLDEMQNKLNFIHGDLHYGNICINNDNKPVFIDFGYSSFILNDESYDTNWEVDLETYLIDSNDKDNLPIKTFTKTHMIEEYYSYCGDLFYFSYNMLLYLTKLRKRCMLSPTEELLYKLFNSFFEIQNNGQIYSLFEYLRILENEITFIVFFLSKSSRLFYTYLQSDSHSCVDIDAFYMQFDPKHFVEKIKIFQRNHILVD